MTFPSRPQQRQLPDDGPGRIEGASFTAYSLCNHAICNIGPEFAKAVVGNAWEEVMDGVVVMAPDEPS